MARFRPNLGDYFRLDESAVRTEYLKRKAARLAGGQHNDHRAVIFRPGHAATTAAVKVFTVWGDSGTYIVHLLPQTAPWMAACSRGGVHDMQPEGAACSHGVAAAAVWQLLTEHQEVPA